MTAHIIVYIIKHLVIHLLVDIVYVETVPPYYCLIPLNKSDCNVKPTPVFSYYLSGSRCEIEYWRGCPTFNKFDNEFECSDMCIYHIDKNFVEPILELPPPEVTFLDELMEIPEENLTIIDEIIKQIDDIVKLQVHVPDSTEQPDEIEETTTEAPETTTEKPESEEVTQESEKESSVESGLPEEVETP